MLTNEHMAFFLTPFPPDEVFFLKGNAYAQEWAIAARIEQVDPAWSFTITDVHCRDKRSVATGSLTILGSIRGNVGMNQIVYRKENLDNPHAEANDAEKSAATDCFKRCARLFGIGRYFLTLPEQVKDSHSYERWYRQNQNGHASPRKETHAGVKLNSEGLALGTITAHVTKLDDKGKRRHSFKVDPLGQVTGFGIRAQFIEAGWIDDSEWLIEDKVEDYGEGGIRALFKPDGEKWWKLERVEPHPELSNVHNDGKDH